MTFIYILYALLLVLAFTVIYLLFDYRFSRKRLMEKPEKLKYELDEKNKIHEEQKVKLANFQEIQQKMDEKVLQVDWYLAHLKEVTTENEVDLLAVHVMELNTRFTIEQVNKSMKFIQEMNSQGK